MPPPNPEQSLLITKLEDVAGMIQKTQTNIKKCPKPRLTQGYVSQRITLLKDYWSMFQQAHNDLLRCTPREQRGEIQYFLNEDYYSIEDLYLCLQADLTDLLTKWEFERKSSNVSNMSSSMNDGQLAFVNLPKIQLPTFSGKYEDWTTYEDLFTALVHNTKITNVQKLHYLKTSVSGEAETLLRHIQITENNYTQAWELLKNRFGNKKMIVHSVLKKLFGQKKIQSQSASQIKSLLDTTVECINSLNNLKINTDSWDPVIIFLVGQKLDAESVKDWEQFAHKDSSEDMPKWEELKKFLVTKFRTLEMATVVAAAPTREKYQTHKAFHVTEDQEEEEDISSIQSAHANVAASQPICTYCQGYHYIFNCKEFTKKPVDHRQEFVRKNGLCYNCLVPYHSVVRCKQKTSCRICRKRHHSLLHQTIETNQEETTQLQQQPEPDTKITTAHLSKQQPGRQVLLATAQVQVKSSDGEIHILRALVDQGSEASFISERAVQLLGLARTKINGVVSGVGKSAQISINHFVDLTITSRLENEKRIRLTAYILKSISTHLPSKYTSIESQDIQTLPLADPTYCTPGKVDVLLGADVFCQIIEEGLVKMDNGIVAQKTCLGWILSGQKQKDKHCDQHKVVTLHITRMVAEDNDLLRKFWEIETDLYTKKRLLTKEEEQCEKIYKETTTREKNGRYKVHLPLKRSIEETVNLCGDTKQNAINRFKSLERKFEKNHTLKKEYIKVINEYKDMGHLRRSDNQVNDKAVYLPHLAVVREDKDTSKLRVVFDASAKGSNSHSLNDAMMVGPVLQPDLRSLVIAWRRHKICVVGDIVKMYRMVNMTEEHTSLQRIVWRDKPEDELDSYDLTTVTFGTAAAPFLAVRTLNQLACDESHEFPETAPLIKKTFYMDDLMTGSENINETKKMCQDIKEILRRGGFQMQKWSSNSEEVLESLKEDNTRDKIEIKLDKVIKILGLTWNRQDDAFEITVNLPEMRNPVTKRSILSDVAHLFDPFGWLAPVIVTAKVLIQRLWLSHLEWDDELPQNLTREWIDYRDELIHLNNIKVPRWLKTTQNDEDVQLHGFSDASTQAYAAVTYLRVVQNGIVHVSMIASRTKVAPLKQLSVPKLELCAAALLAELINDVAELLNISTKKIFVWTDSMVVLSWLQSQPSRWKTFVANRTAEITRLIDNDRWRHVQSAENPADIATRGTKAQDLATQSMWWSGPPWLKEELLPYQRPEILPTELEAKCSHHTVLEESPIWERFSTMSRMKRVLAYCRRMLRKEKGEPTHNTHITPKEMEKIEEECIKFYQNLVYEKDIDDLKKDGRVKKRSNLITLAPFLDEKGLLRVGGRLQNASISEGSKHPIIIPSNQHLTKLIINEAHTRTLHGWNRLMMTYLKTNYWVIGLKSAVRKCIHNCKICIVDKAKVKNQFMGQLPPMRVTQNRPFINSGVDFAGPVLIRTAKGRGHHATKGYISLFVCMATKAIHLEAVTDLTSQAFIAAFRRFVARRGHCKDIWSDNGTNFVGAAKEIKSIFEPGKSNIASEVAELLAVEGTTWHFIPPRMPSYGGLWEAGVQSAKRHLARVNRDTKLTYEELATLLAQVEACLNSRPLCEMDKNTGVPLTPGHFLVGEPLVSVPDLNYEHKNIHVLTRWQLVQKMTQNFWRQWQTEYLNTLQQRYKWQVAVPAPCVGDLVIIKDEILPPTKWLLGRVKYLHPGRDNLVRVVTVQCKGDREIKRPLSKLILLPKE